MRALSAVTILAALAVATPCAAQRESSLTFGADVGMLAPATSGVQFGSSTSFTQLRLGIALTAMLTLEPTLLVADVTGPDGEIALGAGLFYRLSATGVSPYLRPVVDLRRGRGSAVLALDAGFGVGVSAPIADRLDLRVEGTAVRWLGGGSPPSWAREGRLVVGLTYFRQPRP
jgi:hypothetical protein